MQGLRFYFFKFISCFIFNKEQRRLFRKEFCIKNVENFERIVLSRLEILSNRLEQLNTKLIQIENVEKENINKNTYLSLQLKTMHNFYAWGVIALFLAETPGIVA